MKKFLVDLVRSGANPVDLAVVFGIAIVIICAAVAGGAYLFGYALICLFREVKS